jgi:hypothetical protein
MKFFYVLANQFVSILLSSNTITTLHFNTEISYCDRGISSEHLGAQYRRQKTSISLVPKVENIDSNMTCYMKNGKIYVFNLKWSKKREHKNLVIKDAKSMKGGVKILETPSFSLFDAGENYYLENKTNSKLIVNESLLEKTGIVSKWSPVVINGKEYRL